ncbi:MAG TPA: M17 family peptidase N-terminal domain-containing protein, partial [Candidatus Hydrogenedentes bacterium]|nr:M17 family peptidase N-terminal domain-containing protein [Candidatus Hydrogenedentota bacterium]
MRVTVTDIPREWLGGNEARNTWVLQPFTSTRDVDETTLSRTQAQAAKALIDSNLFGGKKPAARALPTPLDRTGGVVLVFAGKGRQRTAENLRRAAALACKCLEANKARRAIVARGSLRDAEAAAFTEGFILAAYRFDQYKSREGREDEEHSLEQVLFATPEGRGRNVLETAVTRAAVIAEGANAARRLG